MEEHFGEFTPTILMLIRYSIVVMSMQFIGAFWYSPSFFGNSWARQVFPSGMPKELMEDKSPFLICTLAFSFLTILLDHVLLRLAIQTTEEAVWAALALWSFALAHQAISNAFSHRGAVLFVIDGLFNLVSTLVPTLLLLWLNDHLKLASKEE